MASIIILFRHKIVFHFFLVGRAIYYSKNITTLIVENDKQMEKVIPVMKGWVNLKMVVSINDLSEETLKKFRNSYPYYDGRNTENTGLFLVRARVADGHLRSEFSRPDDHLHPLSSNKEGNGV